MMHPSFVKTMPTKGWSGRGASRFAEESSRVLSAAGFRRLS